MNVKELVGYLRAAQNVTFVIGAGASISAGIPSAPGLIRLISDRHPHCLARLLKDQRKDYGKVMKALPPGQRQELIQPLLDGAKLNWGHLALASILTAPRPTMDAQARRVLSFNFDFLVERALTMLGKHLPVYDFGVAPTTDVSLLAEQAVVHLHGQSYGFRLLNSDKETQNHVEALRPLFEDSLHKHLTVVIGYSGEADAAFDVIAKGYNSRYPLFWLGYEKEPKAHLAPLLTKEYTHFIGGCDFDQVMIDLAEGLGCWPPEIVHNPPSHVRQLLAELPAYPLVPESGEDLLTDTRARLDLAAGEWDEKRSSIGKQEDALLSGKPMEAAIGADEADEKSRRLRAWDFVRQGNDLCDAAKEQTGEERRASLLAAADFYEKAVALDKKMHQAFYNWGNALAGYALCLSGSERVAAFEMSFEKYAAALALKPDFHEALHNWGVALSQSAHGLSGSERVAAFEMSFEKYSAALALKPDDHEALNNWGHALKAYAQGLSDGVRKDCLRDAEDKLNQAQKLFGKPDYNLACLYALRGETAQALDQLEACADAETLPDADHLRQDSDLDSLRAEPRFQVLLDRAAA